MPSAKDICAAETNAEAWDYIRGHHEAFFWTDDEDHVETWNRDFGSVSGGNPITQEWRSESLWLTYRDKTTEVPLRSDRVDRWIIIHTIAQLVSSDYEFRFCKDSAHSSDQACIALSVAEWDALESAFDSDVVARRFLRINSDFDTFFDEAFPTATVSRGLLDPAMTNWIGGPSYQPAKLEYVIVSEGTGEVLREKLERLSGRYLKRGQVGISTDTVLEMHWVDQSLLSDTVAPLVGSYVVRVVDSTRHGFLIIELVGVAAAWRTDGCEFLDEGDPITSHRWWKFWKPR